MKLIWTFIFLAIAGAIAGISYLLVPENCQTPKFWLSIGAMGVGLFLLYVAVAFAPSPGGEQSGALMRGQFTTGSFFYCLGTFVLAAVAVSPISFTWLAVLHILAVLFWVLAVGIGAVSSAALRRVEQENAGSSR